MKRTWKTIGAFALDGHDYEIIRSNDGKTLMMRCKHQHGMKMSSIAHFRHKQVCDVKLFDVEDSPLPSLKECREQLNDELPI